MTPTKSSFPQIALFATAALLATEAHVTAVPEDLPLADLAARAPAVIHVRALPPGDAPRVLVLGVLFDGPGQLRAGDTIVLRGAFDELFAKIEAARARGEPAPFPVLPTYTPARPVPTGPGAEFIAFIGPDFSEGSQIIKYRYFAEGSVEAVGEAARIRALLAPRLAPTPAAKTPPTTPTTTTPTTEAPAPRR